MIFQVYFIVLPTVTFCLANLFVSYPNPFSFLLFSIRAPNPVSGPESGFGPRIHFRASQGHLIIPQLYFIVLPTVTFYLAYLLVSYPLSFLLFSIRAPNPLSGPESGFGAPIHSQGNLIIPQVYSIVVPSLNFLTF